jgi:peptide/nickel transport system substrate-binding protein
VALVTIALVFPTAAEASDLSVAREFDAEGLDPHKHGGTRSMQVTNLIFDTLLSMDRDGVIHPGLATSWHAWEDGKTYTLTIRDGVKCHDGTVLDAAAVKASIDRAIDRATLNPNAESWGPITSTGVSGNVIRIELSEPFAPFLSFLTSMPSAIICPGSLIGGKYRPVGTGPFKLDKWTRNDRMELVANPDYRNFNPLIENPGRPMPRPAWPRFDRTRWTWRSHRLRKPLTSAPTPIYGSMVPNAPAKSCLRGTPGRSHR